MLSIRFTPRANVDDAEAIDWYVAHSPIAAERLDDAIRRR